VKLAVNQLLPRKPDLVVSGINSGANVGINVLYSGTVAAAIEAAFLGLPAVATSLLLKRDVPADYAAAAIETASVIRDLLAKGLAAGEVASINLPALLPQERSLGVKYCRQCTRPLVDTYDKRLDPRGRPYFWNSSIFTLGTTDADTDVAYLRDGYTTVTPLQFDLTEHRLLARWQGERNADVDDRAAGAVQHLYDLRVVRPPAVLPRTFATAVDHRAVQLGDRAAGILPGRPGKPHRPRHVWLRYGPVEDRAGDHHADRLRRFFSRGFERTPAMESRGWASSAWWRQRFSSLIPFSKPKPDSPSPKADAAPSINVVKEPV